MADPVIHVSESDAIRSFAELLERVRAGAEVVIEDEKRPVAILRPAPAAGRLLSEAIELARKHGSGATMDADFARDIQAAIDSHREPLEPPEWD